MNRIISCVLLLIGIGIPARGAEFLDFVPEDAAVIVRLRDPLGTVSKISRIAGTLDESYRALVNSSLNSVLGVEVANPTLAGVDKNGEWWFVVFFSKNKKMELLFGIPGKNLEIIEETLDEAYFFSTQEQYALYCESKLALQKIKDCIKGKSKSIRPRISKNSLELFNNSDLAFWIDLEFLTALFAKEIQASKLHGPEAEACLVGELISLGVDQTGARQMTRIALDQWSQAIKQAESMTLGISVSKDQVLIDNLIEFKTGGATAKFLIANPGGAPGILDRIPSEYPVKVCLHGDLREFLGPVVSGLIPVDPKQSESKQNVRTSVSEKILGSGISSAILCWNPGVESEQTIWLLQLANSNSFKRGMLELDQASEELKYQVASPKKGESEIDQLLIKSGKEDWQTLFYSHQNYVVFSDPRSIEEVIQSISEPVSHDSLLPAKINFGLIANVSSIAAGLMKQVPVQGNNEQELGPDLDTEFLDELSRRNSQLGVGLTFEDRSAHLRIVVPVETVRSIHLLLNRQ